MKKEAITYLSHCGTTEIHAVLYHPETEPRAILQISHGMVEFIERYEPFAEFLTDHGILVVGNDHLGHGDSINTTNDYGYFGEPDGCETVLSDLIQLTEIVRSRFPNLPYFLLGHSMGSFFARQYLSRAGEALTGAIIMGTGSQSALMLQTGKMMAKTMANVKGWHYRSTLMNRLAFSNYNRKIPSPRTESDWLTKVDEIVDAYMSDQRCTFNFTLNGYYNLFTAISRAQDPKLQQQIPKQLPILFVSGTEDPVGSYGKGVLKAMHDLQKAGLQQVQCKLYSGDRHEILNETDREQVYEDLLRWINGVLSKL